MTTMTTTTTSTSTIIEPTTITILVLYGSQTGNSEQAAKEFCTQCTSEYLYTIYHHQQQHQQDQQHHHQQKSIIPIITKCMSLDDFLEIEYCSWTTIVIIFVSSYGVGGPPLGCYRFRDICDYILQQQEQQQKNDSSSSSSSSSSLGLSLKGIHYAICGLGDSRYSTYFQNPTIINNTLTTLQAQSICSIGEADASVSSKKSNNIQGNNVTKKEQSDVIQEWVMNLWKPLSNIIYNNNNIRSTMATKDELLHMQQQTIAICQKVIPDYYFVDPNTTRTATTTKNNKSINTTTTTTMITMMISILIVILAIFILYIF